MNITLTPGQQAAYMAFSQFIMDPTEPVFVLEGYSGTGKSTLVKTLMAELPSIMKAAKLIHPSIQEREVKLTATTNKAAEALEQLANHEVTTIHSFLGLRVHNDFKTGETKLVIKDRHDIKHDYLLFIDEASYIDSTLLRMIFSQTKHCKIVFMGDPAQLLTVGCKVPPVFTAGFPTAKLTEVVRQAEGNPIIDLSTKFRNTVNTGEFFNFKPDGNYIKHLSRDDFEDAILAEFMRPDWAHNDAKVMAWTNKTVINYNHAINDHVTGSPEFKVGDYGICNKHMAMRNGGIKTDQTVLITSMGPDVNSEGFPGNYIALNDYYSVFLPKNITDKKIAIKQARDADDLPTVALIENTWIDLRPAYSCTINKAQGSTYRKAFIDLDDVSRCNSGEQIARMLYVAVSRASENVFLTGDLV